MFYLRVAAPIQLVLGVFRRGADADECIHPTVNLGARGACAARFPDSLLFRIYCHTIQEERKMVPFTGSALLLCYCGSLRSLQLKVGVWQLPSMIVTSLARQVVPCRPFNTSA